MWVGAIGPGRAPCSRQTQAGDYPLPRSSQGLWSYETATLQLSRASCTPLGGIIHVVSCVRSASLDPNFIVCSGNGFPWSWVM